MGTIASLILLVGLKHVGKSTLARIAARRLGTEAKDLDSEILDRAPGYVSVRELYRAEGRVSFLEKEAAALETTLAHAEPGVIIATGGGLADNDAAIRLVDASNATVLYLSESPLVLYERIRRGGIPAFLDADRPREHFLEIAERRDELYHRIADAVIDLSGMAISEAADRIIEEIRNIDAGQ
jgi:shikimate kinase